MPEYKLKHFQPLSAPADVTLSQRWLVENISRSLPGVRGIRFELELELELVGGEAPLTILQIAGQLFFEAKQASAASSF